MGIIVCNLANEQKPVYLELYAMTLCCPRIYIRIMKIPPITPFSFSLLLFQIPKLLFSLLVTLPFFEIPKFHSLLSFKHILSPHLSFLITKPHSMETFILLPNPTHTSTWKSFRLLVSYVIFDFTDNNIHIYKF